MELSRGMKIAELPLIDLEILRGQLSTQATQCKEDSPDNRGSKLTSVASSGSLKYRSATVKVIGENVWTCAED